MCVQISGRVRHMRAQEILTVREEGGIFSIFIFQINCDKTNNIRPYSWEENNIPAK